MCLRVLCGSENKQRLFPYIALTDWFVQDDQKVSVHLMITIQKSGAQRLFDQPVYLRRSVFTARYDMNL